MQILVTKKIHPFRENTFIKDSKETNSYDQLKDKVIAKYAPRDLKSFQIQHFQDAKGINAIKRVKRIRLISEVSSQDSSKNQWRILLQNKFKSIREYQRNSQRWKSLEKYKAFSKITNLLFFDKPKNDYWFNQERSPQFLLNLLRLLPGLVNLKSLCLSIDLKTHPDILKKLESMPKTLSSLKTAKANFFQKKDQESKISLTSFIKNQNILKCLTHLTLLEANENNFSDAFGLLPKQCKNLVFLNIDFLLDKTNMHIWKSLKEFEKLEVVRIRSGDIESFVENFELPNSTKVVNLMLKKSRWNSIFEKTVNKREVFDSEDLLKTNERLAEFCDKWTFLNNLASLEVSVEQIPRGLLLILSFMNSILRNVPCLVNFYFRTFESAAGYHSNNREKIDLTEIFEALRRFPEKLQTIRIEFPFGQMLTCRSLEEIAFPKLTLLQLEENAIFDLITIENILNAVKKSSTEILLNKYIVNSNEDLLDLIKMLRRAPRSSKIKLNIQIEKLDFNTFYEVLGEFIERVENMLVKENVSLTIIIEELMDGRTELNFLREMFGYVDFEKI